jgi:hypothetical protein
MRVGTDKPIDLAHDHEQPYVRPFRILPLCIAVTMAVGCSGSDDTKVSDGVGGATVAPNVGGALAVGGSTSAGGLTNGSGGAVTATSTTLEGGATNGGVPNTMGGSSTIEGTSVTGGSVATGGISSTGGSKATGGTTSTGGTSARGGSSTTGGVTAAGGTSTGGTTTQGPCDIYAAVNTPCVAAHSTVRALFGTYSGSLYQVRRASDNTTKDIPVLAPGGYANASVQETFCAATTCTISIIYDQSSYKNHLTKSGKMFWLANGAKEADASKAKIKVGGHTVYGVYGGGGIGYRNATTTGVAKGDEPESMYMVVDGKRYNDQCCFDYGNAETTGNDDGNGTMETVYFGSDITWGGKGEGSGPWVAADLENGVYKSDKGGWQSQSVYTASAKSIIANFATVMMKGPSGSKFGLKAGDAQTGALTTMWDGNRPSNGYSPKKLQGAIVLGTGGDGSPSGIGTFFEGVMTKGNPPDSADDAVQVNIVAAGYGK